MKSEERHQLAQNDLQVGLTRGLDRIEPYTNQILAGVVIATLVVVGLIFWLRSSTATSDAGWMRIGSARTADEFLTVADDFPGTAAGNWATLQAARMSYSTGIETSLTDRKSSDESLKQAKDLYDKLLKTKTTPELREEALKGMGLTLEATSGGDVSEAIKAYETLIKEFPDSTFRDYAAHRVEELKAPGASDFYAWFRKQDPKPAPRPEPMDGRPAGDTSLRTPDLPDIDLQLDNEMPAAAPGSTVPDLPAVPPTEGKSLPETPAAPPGDAPATTPEAGSTAPAPIPEATPMPMPEAPATPAPMPTQDPPAAATPMPEPPRPGDATDLPSLPQPGLETPK